jgi:hypothetical protein
MLRDSGARRAKPRRIRWLVPSAILAAGVALPGSAGTPVEPAIADTDAPPATSAAEPSPAPAEPPTPAPTATPAAQAPWVITGSWRVRQEAWDWFRTPGFQDEYSFNGSLIRLAASRQTPRSDTTVEVAQTLLVSLPHNATAPAPQGQLGLGAAYFDANGGQDGSLFLKQAFWRRKGLGSPAGSLRLGRFEFIDGTETTPKDPSLAYLKRERIAHRLLGNFGWSHVGRSFDGIQAVHDTPALNVTAFGGIPTRGVFDLHGMDHLPDLPVAYVAATRTRADTGFQGDARLFGLYYEDTRDEVVKTDNRPQPVRAADEEAIGIGTLGGHALGLWDVNGGKVDGLLWGAAQFGDWGQQSHGAFALAAEVGYQPARSRLKPWFRAGFFYGSGDSDPNDGQHETFFPVLPTPRIYARFPFYTTMNLADAFGQVILRPTPRWMIRSDIHALRLADPNDLWYAGGGAFQEAPVFGYSGRPSGGEKSLATLVDISADYQWRKWTLLSLYLGYARGGGVVEGIYSGNTGFLGYLEATQRW